MVVALAGKTRDVGHLEGCVGIKRLGLQHTLKIAVLGEECSPLPWSHARQDIFNQCCSLTLLHPVLNQLTDHSLLTDKAAVLQVMLKLRHDSIGDLLPSPEKCPSIRSVSARDRLTRN